MTGRAQRPRNRREENDEDKIAAEDTPFPGLSQYRVSKTCCGPCISFPQVRHVRFFGHWEISLGMPIVVVGLATISYLWSLFVILPSYGGERVWVAVIMSVVYFLFVYNYCRIIIDGPGYLPFWWARRDVIRDRIACNWDSPSGIAVSLEQMRWARWRADRRVLQLPTQLRKSARRVVCRGDHNCGFAAGWIGRRNHSFFMRFLWFACIHCAMYTALAIVFVTTEPPPGVTVVSVLLMAGGIGFSVMTLIFSVQTFSDALVGVTQCTAHQRRRFQGMAGLREVFGPRHWLTWILPISPWRNLTDLDLANMDPPFVEPLLAPVGVPEVPNPRGVRKVEGLIEIDGSDIDPSIEATDALLVDPEVQLP